jgi:hypothetical protein
MTRANYLKRYIAEVLYDSIPDLAYEYRDANKNSDFSIDWLEEEEKMEAEVKKILELFGDY